MNTSTDISKDKNNLPRVIFLSMVAALGGFLFGFDSGVINGTVHALQESFDTDAIATGFNVAAMLLGCAIGAFFAGSLTDKFGRKKILILTSLSFIVSAWGSGIATNSTEFIVFRVLGGLAVGAASITAPAYIGEISPPHIRGRLMSLQQMAIVLGLFLAYLSNYTLAIHAGTASSILWYGYQAWRWMFWMELIPASVFFLCLLFVPESPRFLVAAGKEKKAVNVLAKLSNLLIAKKQVEEIKTTVFGNRKPRFSDIINYRTRKIYPIVWVGIAIAALQQFTGINVVCYYGAVLWQAAGFAEGDALLTNVIIGANFVVFTPLAIYLVERVGRKPLLLLGALGQAVSLGIMALIFALGADDAASGIEMTGTHGIMALIVTNIYIAFFAFTWGPIMWVMLGEMFPNKIRGAALALAGLSQWGSNFLVTLSFPALLHFIGLGLSYVIYAFFGIVAYIIVRKFVKETKGRTLEDISHDHD